MKFKIGDFWLGEFVEVHPCKEVTRWYLFQIMCAYKDHNDKTIFLAGKVYGDGKLYGISSGGIFMFDENGIEVATCTDFHYFKLIQKSNSKKKKASLIVNSSICLEQET